MTISLNPGLFRSYNNGNEWSNTRRSAAHGQESQPVSATGDVQASSGVVTLGKRQSPEETAAAILGHVQQGLSELKSQGADDERLMQRLEAAREGIARGYEEATRMLKDMGMLDDELQASIDSGRSMVDDGLASLERSITNPQAQLIAASDSLSMSNRLAMTIVTRDGDRVQVSFSQSSALQTAASSSGFSLSESSARGWQMQVSGSLSEAEQQALSDLFADVQDLSEQFFAGDIGAALDSAMSLGFDGSQLAAMSLDLTQKTVSTSTRAYGNVQQQLPTPQLESLKAPLAYYVDQYVSALDRAGALADPQQTVQDLVHQLLPDSERMSAWDAFHSGLNTLLTGKTAGTA